MTTGIVGGGIMGLSLAYFLQQRGHQVELFERADQLGGLATYQDFGPFVWDRFYHCILPSDRELIGLLGEIGLAGQLRWQVTKTGFFVTGCPRRGSGLHSVSNAVEFLRFPPLSLVDRLRLGYTILACSRIRDWRSLESQPVEEWLGRLSGQRTFETIWKPLLVAKFGEAYQQASAVNIWATIRRMFSARQEGLKKESLGFVSGGYRTILTRLREQLEEGGPERPPAKINLGVDVRAARRSAGGWEIVTAGGTRSLDRLVFTTPTALTARILQRPLATGPAGGSVGYVGVVCLALLLRRSLSPYYVINVADPEVPFTGVIEMSNLVTTGETAGRHLVYVPKYAPPGDPIFQAPAEEVLQRFLPGLRKMLGGPVAEEIEAFHVFRAPYVQPLQVRHYSEQVPPLQADEEGLYFVNSAQLVSSNLNNNEVIRHARACAEEISVRCPVPGARLGKDLPLSRRAPGTGHRAPRGGTTSHDLHPAPGVQ